MKKTAFLVDETKKTKEIRKGTPAFLQVPLKKWRYFIHCWVLSNKRSAMESIWSRSLVTMVR